MEQWAKHHGRLPELAALALLVLLYLATVLPALGNDPIAGGDEGWIISASAKLSEEGVFGSDLFEGFYGAEEHYYFNLPLHHLVLAGAFELTGVGLTEARGVSVVFGLAVLALTYVLGRKIGGAAAALLAAALAVLLRLNLTPFSGLTLTDLGATVRYDLIAVPYALVAVLLLMRRPFELKTWHVGLSGVFVGLAALTQFIGAFFLLPLAIYLLTLALPLGRRLVWLALLGAAAVAPFIPYAVYAAGDLQGFRGQARAVEQDFDLLSPAFYWRQLRDEPERYDLGLELSDFPDSLSEALKRPSARLTLLIVGPLAVAYTLWRGRSDTQRRLLGFVIAGLIIQLALFESTKRFVYWVVVVPFLCVAIADMALALWQMRPKGQQGADGAMAGQWVLRASVAFVLAVFAFEGLAVAVKDVRDARDAPSYAALGANLRETLPPGTRVMGDNRLWPALRDQEHRSLLLLFYHTNPRISRERSTDVAGAMERVAPEYVLLSPLSREILGQLTPEHSAEFDRYLSDRMDLVETIMNPAYGPHELYRRR